MSKKIKLGFVVGIVFPIIIAATFVVGASSVTVVTQNCFTDVSTSDWFHDFVCWLFDNDITAGYQDGTYRPNNPITRAEAAVFIQRGYELAEANDDDTLGGLSCANSQIAKWSMPTSTWTCSDDEDTDTTYSAGDGLSLAGTIFNVDFAGSGTASTSSRSDHHHDGIYVNEGQVGSITSAMISDGTVSANDILDGEVLDEILDDDGDGSGLDADMVDGMDSTDFATASDLNSLDNRVSVLEGVSFSTYTTFNSGVDVSLNSIPCNADDILVGGGCGCNPPQTLEASIPNTPSGTPTFWMCGCSASGLINAFSVCLSVNVP
jgi:hypothetical protein